MIDPDLEALRRHRAELLEAINALEQALAAPAPGRTDAWRERVTAALMELSADFRQHVDITEGGGGFYAGVLATAPRLAHAVARLTRDHTEISGRLEALLDGVGMPADVGAVDSLRDHGNALLVQLVRHRQRGADLVYEAYQSDIGGET